MPWTPLHARLHRTLRQGQLLERQQRLLVAVSGGQDSLCLIKLLLDLQPKWGWQLAIAHCDHRWRPDSQANADYVASLAQMWQLPFYCQVLKLADSESLEREAQAREWRYQALTAIAQENNYSCLVTGHTKSDLAETLLYNLFRGSGADGLQALSWRRPLTSRIQLIRPLLEVTRSETAQFCKEFSLAIWQDITNDELKYRRNRIRQELLPYIRSHFNPQVEHALAQTAELLRADIEYLEIAARELLQAAMPTLELSDLDSHKVGLNRVILRQAPLALQRRVIRQFLHQILGIAPNFAQIKKVTALITAANRSRSDPFPGGEVAEVEGSWIWFQQPR